MCLCLHVRVPVRVRGACVCVCMCVRGCGEIYFVGWLFQSHNQMTESFQDEEESRTLTQT